LRPPDVCCAAHLTPLRGQYGAGPDPGPSRLEDDERGAAPKHLDASVSDVGAYGAIRACYDVELCPAYLDLALADLDHKSLTGTERIDLERVLP
jgi:hypothetical protein